ncbi:MAG: nucleotidyltransferase family protein [Myxococcales bacterium]
MTIWGVIPAAGRGSRIQPLAFSKELLPVGVRRQGGEERPRAVSEYLVDRMVRAGARKLCFVISPGKSDIVEYFGGSYGPADLAYVVQQRPAGLCDALFRALPLVGRDDEVLIGLPDTVWFPEDGFCRLDAGLSFLLFPVDRPQLFDTVVTANDGTVQEIQVKPASPKTHWIWGAFKLDGGIFADLHALWLERDKADEYIGTLVNEYLARGGQATGVRAGQAYVDTGTVHGYREAMQLLRAPAVEEEEVLLSSMH